MDSKELEELRTRRASAIMDFNSRQYNKEEYKKITEDYLQSEKCAFLSEAQRSRLRQFFEKIEQNIVKEVPEDKFKVPYQSYMEQIDRIIFQGINYFNPETHPQAEEMNNNLITNLIISKFEKYFELDGKIDKDLGKMLYSLYTNPSISLGVHGTTEGNEFDISAENNSYIKNGLACRYPDLRGTVGFQHGRGMRHNHGELDFLEILTYHYPNITAGHLDSSGIAQTQHTVFVAIPTEMSTCNHELFEGGDFIQEKYYCLDQPIEDRRRLKPQYIVGMIKDGDLRSFVGNPNFSSELLVQQNEEEKNRNIEEEKQLMMRLGKETEPQQRNTNLKEKVFNAIKQLISKKKILQKQNDTEERE